VPSNRSPEALPADHQAWKDFDLLMAKLDSLGDVDNDLDDDWVGDLRRGVSSRLEDDN
jgi:hypothetical protein